MISAGERRFRGKTSYRGCNRCNYCNKFQRWEDLRNINFIPDSEFGPEESEMICNKCWERYYGYVVPEVC